MKIQSINTINYMQNKPQSFKGLWGLKTTKDFHKEGDIDLYSGTNGIVKKVYGYAGTIETKCYYPFKNESKKNIEKVIKDNTKSEEKYYDKEYPSAGIYGHEVIVKVGPVLPFTEQEWTTKTVKPSKLREAIEIILRSRVNNENIIL